MIIRDTWLDQNIPEAAIKLAEHVIIVETLIVPTCAKKVYSTQTAQISEHFKPS